MPTITSDGAQAALAIRGEESFLILLTIAHADITTLRFTSNTEDIVSRGNTFTRYPFMLELLSNSEGVPTGRLRIANVHRAIWNAIEDLTTSPTFTFEIVLSSDPETVIDAYELAELWRVTATADAIEGELTHERYAVEPWPAPRLTPQYFPWLSR